MYAYIHIYVNVGFPRWLSGEESAFHCKRYGFQSLGQEDLWEKEMATHSRILAWGILWTVEPGGLQSMGSQKSWTRLSNQATTTCKCIYIYIHIYIYIYVYI